MITSKLSSREKSQKNQHINFARSVEERREQSKSREEIVLSVQEGRGLVKVPKTMKSSIVRRRQVEEY
jgi:hypothetical protein